MGSLSQYILGSRRLLRKNINKRLYFFKENQYSIV